MSTAGADSFIAGQDDLILVTGATGFIGRRVVNALLDRGFGNLRCLARPSAKAAKFQATLRAHKNGARAQIMTGNLLSPEDCAAAAKGAAVIFHLAAARGEKSFPDAFLNSAVTTRNLLGACVAYGGLRRFVNVSSFAVYSNKGNSRLLDETSAVEPHPESLGSAYAFSKAEQDKVVTEYGQRFGIPYVILRPGYVAGPGNPGIHSRVGIGTFGIFMHLGGGNRIPFTYVDNCADAIVLAGLTKGVDNEIFNVVDDDLPTSRQFLRLYKRNVQYFRHIYVPHAASYLLCSMWEWYSKWSQGQLPLAYNRGLWHSAWKRTKYSNAKLKKLVGWKPMVPTAEGLRLHFEACRRENQNA